MIGRLNLFLTSLQSQECRLYFLLEVLTQEKYKESLKKHLTKHGLDFKMKKPVKHLTTLKLRKCNKWLQRDTKERVTSQMIIFQIKMIKMRIMKRALQEMN